MRNRYAALVYQGGIANVFEIDHITINPDKRRARRLLQGSFRDCLMFARGMKWAGAIVMTAHCRLAGDITDAEWSLDLEDAIFAEEVIAA